MSELLLTPNATLTCLCPPGMDPSAAGKATGRVSKRHKAVRESWAVYWESNGLPHRAAFIRAGKWPTYRQTIILLAAMEWCEFNRITNFVKSTNAGSYDKMALSAASCHLMSKWPTKRYKRHKGEMVPFVCVPCGPDDPNAEPISDPPHYTFTARLDKYEDLVAKHPDATHYKWQDPRPYTETPDGPGWLDRWESALPPNAPANTPRFKWFTTPLGLEALRFGTLNWLLAPHDFIQYGYTPFYSVSPPYAVAFNASKPRKSKPLVSSKSGEPVPDTSESVDFSLPTEADITPIALPLDYELDRSKHMVAHLCLQHSKLPAIATHTIRYQIVTMPTVMLPLWADLAVPTERPKWLYITDNLKLTAPRMSSWHKI